MKGITLLSLFLLLFAFAQAFEPGRAFGTVASAASADAASDGAVRAPDEKEAQVKGEPEQTKPARKTEWLVFSATEHQNERKQVVRAERIPAKRANEGTIYIALTDLNNDGTEEVFVYFDSKDRCGSFGCTMNIYRKKGQRLVPILGPEFNITIEFDKKGRQKKVSVLPSTTKGWRDIKISDAGTMRWNGKSY